MSYKIEADSLRLLSAVSLHAHREGSQAGGACGDAWVQWAHGRWRCLVDCKHVQHAHKWQVAIWCHTHLPLFYRSPCPSILLTLSPKVSEI